MKPHRVFRQLDHSWVVYRPNTQQANRARVPLLRPRSVQEFDLYCCCCELYDGAMRVTFDPLSLLVTAVAGWINQHQRHIIEYLIEENGVLREQIGNRRLKFKIGERNSNTKADVLSSVNDPNIATIYDLQRGKGLRFLIIDQPHY